MTIRYEANLPKILPDVDTNESRQAVPVPAWIILKTKRDVRTNPKRRAWRSTDV